MNSRVDVERPEVSMSADLTLVSRGITVAAAVERSDEFALVVRPASAGHARSIGAKPGDSVELYWRAGYEERTLPAVISGVEDEEVEGPAWKLQATGPASRSQRRKAVRAWVELPVSMTVNSAQLNGLTADLSEAGLRGLFDGWGLPPEPGTPVQLTISLDKGLVDAQATVVRGQTRGVQWEIAVEFAGISEKDQDRLRQRVFQALREERTRTVE